MTDDVLVQAFEALASPVRLQLLRELRTPKVLSEIELAIARGEGDDGTQHNISRQSVRKHLDRLLELGVVHARTARRARGETTEYVVNHQAIFAVTERFRDLAHLRAVEAEEVPTHAGDEAPSGAFRPATPRGAAAAAASSAREARPCLVLAKGLDEGRVFPLAPERGSWTIGRHRGADVDLDFDPFVSRENALLRRAAPDGHFLVSDLAASTNGTFVNFRRLAPGSTRALAAGDIIGVGRSLLVLWP